MMNAQQGSRVFLVGVALALQACTGAGGRGPEAAPERRAAVCDSPVAIPQGLIRPGGIVLFGEIHGVRELPAVFGDVVCTVAASGLPVEVGLEIPKGEQPIVDRFMESSGSSSEAATLIASAFWSRPYQDGRSSQARLDLLDRLRRLRAEGMPVEVFLLDVDPDEDMAERDRTMAQNVADRAKANPEAATLVLVGEVHAWKTKGSPWNQDFLPMGWHLAKAGLDVRSLGRATPAGRAWICTSASVSECGERQMGAYGSLPSGRAEGMELLPEPSERGYDGMYGTAGLTASPPAGAPRGDHP